MFKTKSNCTKFLQITFLFLQVKYGNGKNTFSNFFGRHLIRDRKYDNLLISII